MRLQRPVIPLSGRMNTGAAPAVAVGAQFADVAGIAICMWPAIRSRDTVAEQGGQT